MHAIGGSSAASNSRNQLFIKNNITFQKCEEPFSSQIKLKIMAKKVEISQDLAEVSFDQTAAKCVFPQADGPTITRPLEEKFFQFSKIFTARLLVLDTKKSSLLYAWRRLSLKINCSFNI